MRITHQIADTRDRLSGEGWPLLPLRLLVGLGFAAHGWAKLARGVDSFAAIVGAMHLPAPVLTAWATTLLELLGGLTLAAGIAVAPCRSSSAESCSPLCSGCTSSTASPASA